MVSETSKIIVGKMDNTFMNYKLTPFYCLFVIIIATINCEQELLKDYCQKETFKPSCPNNEVILMKSALYGRMKIGRCVIVDSEEDALISNPRYLGCSANVMHVLDGRCTGKSTCEVAALDDDLQKLNRCFKGIVSYLEADYTCIPILSDNSCEMTLKSSSAVYILSSSIRQSKCGTPDNPLMLEASAGQKLKVGIVNLNNSAWSTYCPFSIGRITEANSDKNKEFCIDSLSRHQILYASHKNKIEISFEKGILDTMKRNTNSDFFLISLEAIGCSDLVPAEDSWLKRIDDIITIGCYSSRKTWQLKCVDNNWVGVVGNCSGGHAGNSHDTTSLLAITKDESLESLGIIAISAVGLAICGLIIGVGYLCGKRYEKKTSKILDFKEQNQSLGHDANYYNNRLLQSDTNGNEDNNYKAAYYVLDDVNNDKN